MAEATIKQIAQMFDLKVVISGTSVAESAVDTSANRARAAQAWLSSRRKRDRFFDAALFSDPAWDMLLDLYVEYHRGREVMVSKLSAAARVPHATGLRWLKSLENKHLVYRRPDLRDGRCVFVGLNTEAVEALDGLMDDFLSGDSKLGIARIDIVETLKVQLSD